MALLSALPASAVPFTYRYFQFKPTALKNSGTAIQMAEFTFSNGGTLLNLNNRDGTGVNVVPVSASSAGQVGTGAQDPPKIVDGLPLVNGGTETKWYRGSALADGNELIFDFNTPITVDRYNFCTGGDDTAYNRTPVSWRISARNSTSDPWTLLDVRVNAVPNITNLTYQGGWDLPADIPPVINSFTTPFSIVLNGTPITYTYNTQYSTSRDIVTGETTLFPLATEAGTQVLTPPSDATTPYTLVGKKAGSVDAASTSTIRSVIGGASTYQYVRYKITKRRPGVAGLVQLTEFEFYNTAVSESKIPVASVSNPGGSNAADAAEGVTKLIDGLGNKWLDNNNKEVIFDFGTPVSFNKYSFITGNDDPSRDPIQWTLEGSNDQERWNIIENVNFDYGTPLARSTSSTILPLPGPSMAPAIEFFTASAATLISGQSITLNWSTQSSSSVEISPAPGAGQALFGSVTLTPTVDTTYTLTAVPLAGGVSLPVTRTLTVKVVPDPGKTEIIYDDFAQAGSELVQIGTTTITAPDSALPGRLRLTTSAQSQSGAAWFLNKLDGTAGFEANFGLSMNSVPNNFAPADGIAFVIHNSPAGTGELGSGENGVLANSINITFKAFGFNPQDASRIQVTQGVGTSTIVLASATAYTTPGVELYGIPGVDAQGNYTTTGGFPYTLGSLATDPAYRIRVVYTAPTDETSGDLDVYLDGIAVIQNVQVDLGSSAADESGKSYFGFSGRTGGNTQFNDITDWSVKFGDFAELLPYGMVKTLFRYTVGTAGPTAVDLVWNADAAANFYVVSSPDLATWTKVPGSDLLGVDGQLGYSVPITATSGAKLFYRVARSVPVPE